MDIFYHRNFSKSMRSLQKKERQKVDRFLMSCESCTSAEDFISKTEVKAITGYTGFYRIRFGRYRLGIELDKNTNSITAHFAGPRGDFYKNFPPRRR